MAYDFTNTTSSDQNIIIRDGKDAHPSYEKCSLFSLNESEKPRQGWARRKDRGDGGMYGAKFIGRYRNDVREWFDAGEKEKSKKMTPGGMREALSNKYPDAMYTIPGEIEIRSEISKLIDEKKNKGRQQTPRATSVPLPAYVVAAFQEIVMRNYRAKPNAILAEVEKQLLEDNNGVLPEDYPSGEAGKKKMKSKIQAIKGKRKKDAMTSVLDS